MDAVSVMAVVRETLVNEGFTIEHETSRVGPPGAWLEKVALLTISKGTVQRFVVLVEQGQDD
jgi:hypothetical protein